MVPQFQLFYIEKQLLTFFRVRCHEASKPFVEKKPTCIALGQAEEAGIGRGRGEDGGVAGGPMFKRPPISRLLLLWARGRDQLSEADTLEADLAMPGPKN